jgi:hypothetical protein
MIATVCTVLMLISVVSAGWGYINLQRARAADAAAQKSRADAEKLVGFLIEDFYSELEPTGRLDTLGRLAHMTVGYYDGLPPDLVTPRTQSNRAMALIREAAALTGHGDPEGGYRKYAEAQKVFEQLRAAGDKSEPTTWGLALALMSQGAGVLGGARGTPQQLQQAADLLRPLVYGPNPSRRVRQTYADTLNYLSHTLPLEQGVAVCEEARKILVGLGALELTDLNAASAYADTTDSQARHTLSLNRVEEAQKLETEVFEMAEKVLAQRPGDLRSMANRYFAADMLASLANRRHDDAAVAEYALRSKQAAESNVLFQPAELRLWGYVSNGSEAIADGQLDRGEVRAALATRRELAAMANDKRRPSSLGPILANPLFRLAGLEREAGEKAASDRTLEAALAAMAEFVATLAPDDSRRALLDDMSGIARSNILVADARYAQGLDNAQRQIARVDAIKIAEGDRNGLRVRDNLVRGQARAGAFAALRLGRYAPAEALARRRLALPPDQTSEADPFEEQSAARTQLAHALAGQGRGKEASAALAPALAYYRLEQERNAHGYYFRRAYAYALYVSALTREDASARAADLAEAKEVLDGLSAEPRTLASVRELSALIAAARAG